MFGQKRNNPIEKDSTTVKFGSCGFLGLLFIILLLLKAGIVETAAMGWSWWWITSPLWGPIALVVGIVCLCVIVLIGIVLIVAILEVLAERREKRKSEVKRKKEVTKNYRWEEDGYPM